MKIAYLITTYNNPLHLNRLIRALDQKSVSFFIHIDKKTETKYNIPKKHNIYILKENISVYWGSFTFIEAVIKLINSARNITSFDYYILLSGSDYPIKSNSYILKFLNENKGKEFINISQMPNNNKSFERIDYFYISTYIKNYNLKNILTRLINFIVSKFKLKRKHPEEFSSFTFYAGSNWWGLSHNAIEFILDFISINPKFTRFYKYTFIPEEMFFHTILGNSNFKENVINSFTYTEWSQKTDSHPSEISMNHMPLLANDIINTEYGNGKSYILFARKFSDNSTKILKYIDKFIRI